ncbi:sugar ABC transporter substrate-binding protein [Anaerosacchariphilus polymeriproducens]|uniref:Sugar ABC transporter substrate-binding protein n=1 Tax=Anaerosacchariphilus polymeriproducens TaxID=1812858 RepID=A0A371ARU5_9FIRM|nr:sugar ABC transporter substrate-binding protein [Anaerosacchariphilus polymeriproducens]
MKVHRIKLLFLAVVGFIIVFLIFMNKEKETVTLEFGMFAGSNWEVPNGNCYAIIDSAIKRFEKENPGVKIHYSSGILKEDYSEWFSKQLLLGKEPDVFMVLEDDFITFSSIGVLKNLDKFINNDKGFKKEAFYSSVLGEGRYEESQYALPYETVPVLMFANKTLLKSEGIEIPDRDWTWDKFYEICEKVTKDTDADGVVDQFGSYDYSWENAVFANGGKLFQDKGSKCYVGSDNVVEAVKFVYKLNQLNQNHQVTSEEFDSGKVAFRPFPFSEFRSYQDYPLKVKKYSNFEWDCITMPAGPKGDNISQISTLQIGISARTTKEQLAWKFIKYLTYNPQTQLDIYRYSQGASVLKEVTESEVVNEELKKEVEKGARIIDNVLLSRIIEHARTVPKFPKYKTTKIMVENQIDQILQSDDNKRSSLMAIQWEIDKFLKK